MFIAIRHKWCINCFLLQQYLFALIAAAAYLIDLSQMGVVNRIHLVSRSCFAHHLLLSFLFSAPVESIFVSDNNGTAAFSPPELVYTSTEPATLRCMAEGAFPAPDLQLSVANMDVGSRLAWKFT